MKNGSAILNGSYQALLELEQALEEKDFRHAIELSCVVIGAMEFLQDEIIKEAQNVKRNETVH